MNYLINAKYIIKSFSNMHRQGKAPNVFLFSTPRSGSTWLLELIWTQPGFKHCDEPLNLRDPQVRKNLGINQWKDLYTDACALPALERYFRGFQEGKIGFKNPKPFAGNYRPLSSRIVYKIIHGGEGYINWFRDTFQGKIVVLLRHPVPVTLSREVLPRLHAYLPSDYGRHFSMEQTEFAQEIIDRGSRFEQGILSWCLQNAVPLWQRADDWVVVSYEQLVSDPEPLVLHLARQLELPEPDRMLERLSIPSGSSRKSDNKTQQFLQAQNVPEERRWLIEKWKGKVTQEQTDQAQTILDMFQIRCYSAESVLPTEELWLTEPV
jgi:hypothetical protein